MPHKYISFYEVVIKELNEGNYIDLTCLNFAKAFETISKASWHGINRHPRITRL